MRHVYAFAALVVAAGVLASGSASAAAAAAGGDVARGKAVWGNICYSCHGYEGQGGSTGPRVSPPMAYPAFSAFVRTTSGAMPPFTEKVLTEQQVRDIHAYLSSIPAGPNPNTIQILQ